jgi:methylglyoxal synthase
MRVALIAHDGKNPTPIEFERAHRETLQGVDLRDTGTTGSRLREATGLETERKESGPDGGDLQIGAEVAGGTCEAVVCLRDPLTAQLHEPDISALLRI